MYILVNTHLDVHVGWADSVATNEVCVCVCVCVCGVHLPSYFCLP